MYHWIIIKQMIYRIKVRILISLIKARQLSRSQHLINLMANIY